MPHISLYKGLINMTQWDVYLQVNTSKHGYFTLNDKLFNKDKLTAVDLFKLELCYPEIFDLNDSRWGESLIKKSFKNKTVQQQILSAQKPYYPITTYQGWVQYKQKMMETEINENEVMQ